tara:strand:- start:1034 stop:1894 length:861 start_codon:yes stop_codon:yes gene_type:complete
MNPVIKKITDELETKLNSIVIDEQQYLNYLNFVKSNDRRRSFNNTFLIFIYNKEAQLVLTYKQWIEKNRIVVACITCRAFKNKECKCKERLAPLKIPQFRPIIIEDKNQKEEDKRIYYRAYYVFDLKDTEPLNDDGIEIVNPYMPELLKGEDSAELFTAIQEKLIEADQWHLRVVNYYDASNGFTNFTQKLIQIQKDMSQLQKTKTLAHEVAHKLMHKELNYLECREIAEVEAESVAYIVLNYFGFKTDDYSLKYIAGWQEDDKKTFKNSLSNIYNTANKIIDALT